MTKKSLIAFCIALACLALALPASAQNEPKADDVIPSPPPDTCSAESRALSAASWKTQVICSVQGPASVQGYRVRCNNASFLDYQIADCCVAGDHWQLKGKNWDTHPQTAVTTSPGGANAFGLPARLYNFGGTPQNPGNIDAYLECSYLHGVDLFGAGAFIALSSDGNCTVTPDTPRSRIDRTP